MSVEHTPPRRLPGPPGRDPSPERGWTITEATQVTGLSHWQIRYAMRQGHIAAERVGAGALVLLDREDVVAFAQTKGKGAAGSDASSQTLAGSETEHSRPRGER